MVRINSIQDVEREISNMPVDTNMYNANYIDEVAKRLVTALYLKGFSWGDDLDKYPMDEDEFWEIWEDSEVN